MQKACQLDRNAGAHPIHGAVFFILILYTNKTNVLLSKWQISYFSNACKSYQQCFERDLSGLEDVSLSIRKKCITTFWLWTHDKLAVLTVAYHRPFTDIFFLRIVHSVLMYSLLHDSISGDYGAAVFQDLTHQLPGNCHGWGCSPGGRKQLPERLKLSPDFYWIIPIKICHQCKEGVDTS